MSSNNTSQPRGQRANNNNRGESRSDSRGDSKDNRRNSNSRYQQERSSDWEERVLQVKRVTKVVKGGKNMSFRALVVIGDMRGTLGIGLGKAAEVVDAVRKAVEDAKKK